MAAKPKLTVERYLAAQASELAALRASVKGLDLSYASVDRVETYYRGVLAKKPPKSELDVIANRVERYLGATVAEHTNGKWKIVAKVTMSRAAIEVPGIKGRMYEPQATVWGFNELRTPGLFRENTERWDLALRRADLAELLAHRSDVLAKLREDIRELTGKRVAKLDGSAPRIQLLEDTLVALDDKQVTLERRREIRQRIALQLGLLYTSATGETKWTVMDRPEHADFGQFLIGYWSPSRAILYLGARTEKGSLVRHWNAELEEAQEARAARRPGPVAAGHVRRRTTGTWFVLVERARAITLAKLAKRLAALPYRLELHGERSLSTTWTDDLTDNEVTLDVGFSAKPHVAIEAAEIAERHERPELARLDARYELLWDLEYSDEVYNRLARISEELAKACGGVIFDVTDGRFV